MLTVCSVALIPMIDHDRLSERPAIDSRLDRRHFIIVLELTGEGHRLIEAKEHSLGKEIVWLCWKCSSIVLFVV